MSESADVDPWLRYGWMLWSVYLLFLAFPLVEVFQANAAPGPRTLGSLLIVAFGAAFLLGSVWATRAVDTTRTALLVLCLMVALGAGLVPLIGIEALGVVPFLISFCTFLLPRPWNWAASLGWIALTLTTSVTLTSEIPWIFTVITLAVAMSCAAGRVLSDHGDEYSSIRKELAVTDERDRVARDVHDVLGHSLTVISLKAQLAGRLMEADPESARTELAEIESLSRAALSEIRSTVGGLRSTRLAEELAAASTALDAAEIAADLPADVQAAAVQHRSAMAWVLREAVTNVVRHSMATRCEVRLDSHRLSVSDDGVGLGGAVEGNGLHGLRDRVTASGGTLTLGRGLGTAGVCVEAEWE